MALSSGRICRLAEGSGIFVLADSCPITLVVFAGSRRVAKNCRDFRQFTLAGRCQYTLLWHIGCQSVFDELVSMSFRPVDRGFCRMGSILASFCPVKSGFCRMGKQLGCRSQQKTSLGWALPFLTKWCPPLSRGWHCPQGVFADSLGIRVRLLSIIFGRKNFSFIKK